MEPLLLSPAVKDYLWGGTRLSTEYNKVTDVFPLAETWECSTHPDGPSIIRSGTFSGCSLADVLGQHPEFLGRCTLGKLPVLVKLIDAQQDLSVQVHPDDEYAKARENDNGKTEMWYVLDAKPGAKIVHGFAHSVTPDQLRVAIQSRTLSKYLRYVPVKKGDVFFIPPGTIHAIGAGVLLVEVQESSNVTYRVYDYDRCDRNGKRRPLHFDKAFEVLNTRSCGEVRQKPHLIRYYPGYSSEALGQCMYFNVEKIQTTRIYCFTVTESSYQILLCIEGDGELLVPNRGQSLCFMKGDCIFLPADIGSCEILGNTTLIKVRE